MNNVKTPTKVIALKILNKEFKVSCPEGAEEQLHVSAQYLDHKMHDIRNTGRVIGLEKIAVMAALNLSHALLTHRQHQDIYINGIQEQIEYLQKKLDAALMGSVS